MTAFAQLMSEIHLHLEQPEQASRFEALHDVYNQRLQSVFYEKKSDMYKSMMSLNRHSPFLGYVNLFPLFFGLIPESRLSATLDFIQDPSHIWSPFGLLSLSRQDRYYMKNDQYWTGPIWVNINYLVLRGLYINYMQVPRARELYARLRQSLIHAVCGTL